MAPLLKKEEIDLTDSNEEVEELDQDVLDEELEIKGHACISPQRDERGL